MLLPAFYLLTAAILLGALVALSYLGLMRWRWWPGVIHGALGVAGVTLLFFSFGGPPRGAEFGVQSFGFIAAWIALTAVLLALIFVTLWRLAKTRAAWLIGLHATIALTAYCFLLAYVVF